MSLSLSLWWPHNTSWLCNDIVFMWWKIASCFPKVFKACQPPKALSTEKQSSTFPLRPSWPWSIRRGKGSLQQQHQTEVLEPATKLPLYSTIPPLIQFSFCSKRKKSQKMMKYKSRIQRTFFSLKKSRAILSLKVTFILPLSEKRMGTRNILTMS